MGALNFYFNDLYPNQGYLNTRSQTVPESDDRQALAEDNKGVESAKTNPVTGRNMIIALGVFLGLVILLGVGK